MAKRGANKATLIGNVGDDPTVRYMPNGDAVANLTLATSETWKDKNSGNEESRTEWHKVTFYRRLAEIVEQYVKKGSKIYIEGKLQTRSWEQDGVKRYVTEIIAHDMQMLDSRDSGSEQGQQQQRPQQSQQPQHRQAPAQHQQDSFDDDIPF